MTTKEELLKEHWLVLEYTAISKNMVVLQMQNFNQLLDKYTEEIRNELNEFWGQAAEILKKGLEDLKKQKEETK